MQEFGNAAHTLPEPWQLLEGGAQVAQGMVIAHNEHPWARPAFDRPDRLLALRRAAAAAAAVPRSPPVAAGTLSADAHSIFVWSR